MNGQGQSAEALSVRRLTKNRYNKVSSIMGRDDSWPTTVLIVGPSGDCSPWSIHQPSRPISVWMGEVSTRKHPEWQNRTSDRESDGRFWIGKPGFLFEFPSNQMSISLSFGNIRSFGDIRLWQTDRRTDNVDHYYSWPPHCGRPANGVFVCPLL